MTIEEIRAKRDDHMSQDQAIEELVASVGDAALRTGSTRSPKDSLTYEQACAEIDSRIAGLPAQAMTLEATANSHAPKGIDRNGLAVSLLIEVIRSRGCVPEYPADRNVLVADVFALVDEMVENELPATPAPRDS